MKRTLVLSVLTLAILGGVASADRHHRDRWQRGSNWSGGVAVTASRPRVVVQPRVVVHQAPRRVYVQHTRVVRRPIFVAAPRVRVRYYNYYQRPTVLAENYAPMNGYYWVAGQWSWTGYEWTWTAGHYEPDPNYIDPSYDNASYDNGYAADDDCDHDRY